MSNPLSDLFNAQVVTERTLLGALIIDPDQMDKINTTVDEFRLMRHRWIFTAMQKARSQDSWEPFYIQTINILESSGQLRELGGAAYLTSLINYCEDSQDAPRYAHALREWAMKRSLFENAQRLVKAAFSLEPIPDDMRSMFFG